MLRTVCLFLLRSITARSATVSFEVYVEKNNGAFEKLDTDVESFHVEDLTGGIKTCAYSMFIAVLLTAILTYGRSWKIADASSVQHRDYDSEHSKRWYIQEGSKDGNLTP